MKILFTHRNFPAQFRHILEELVKDPNNEVLFLTNAKNDKTIPGVKKYIYGRKREVPKNCHRYLVPFEESVIHGQAVAEACIILRNQGFVPDVIFAHAWGNSLFLKDVYPDVPLIDYCEWYFRADSADILFANPNPNEDVRAKNRCGSAQMALDMFACDYGITPTHWQKEQYPKEFHNKIEVLHDGIDTEYLVPDNNVEFQIPNSDIKLTCEDEVLVYATRGLEPYRGFPQFMHVAEKLLKKRPNLKVVVAGKDRCFYSEPLPQGTYKELMLNKLDLDMSRIFFTDLLPYEDYRKLLQVASVHVYLTYPYVLSWSLLDSMSVGNCIVASGTEPVKEVIQDGYNGILCDFFNIDEIADKVEYVLDNPDKVQSIKENARNTVVEKYDLKKLMPRHIEIIKSFVKEKV